VGPRRWYGWQLLLADGAAFGALAIGTAADVRGDAAWAVGIPAVLTYKIVPPLIHWGHRRGAIGWASFGIRDGVPALGFLAGLAASDCRHDVSDQAHSICVNNAAGIGTIGGMVVASILDASLLAWDAPSAPLSTREDLMLNLAVQPHGATFGLARAF
jgi:hypothetical protein